MDDLKVRLARKCDRENILKLFDTVFNEQQRSVASNRNEKFWNWKYEDNVFGIDISNDLVKLTFLITGIF